jgi:hypothetical protein
VSDGRVQARIALPFALVALGTAASAAQLTADPGAVPSGAPFNNSETENVDLGDVDLDGDWDIAMADGGDWGNEQNRLWINQGGLQGGTLGFFVDETAARCPVVLDASRDIEYGDYDADGDLDVYSANTSQLMIQTSRFWTNQGQEQGGTLGFFVDETALRWVGLGGPGSSIVPSIVLPSGGFIDWVHDGDFGDLDNDGDLDLVHVPIGGATGGQVPTRLFLNDGAGFFSEFNPSGFQLAIFTIKNGDPGLWCDGVQQAETADASGAFCDVASAAEDGDLGDIDGDFDLDLLLGNRNGPPRMFASRLEGSTLAPQTPAGGLGFRDVTSAVFLPGYVTGNGAFEQELGDMDGDADLDILGVNWGASWGVTGASFLTDKLLENDGSGRFPVETLLPDSGSEDIEGDFLDFDGDGDLDVYVSSVSHDRLYRNESAGAGLVFVAEPLEDEDYQAYDADAADTDGDGDTDVIVAHISQDPNVLRRNDYGVADVHAPKVPRVEAVGTPAAFAGELPVRAHVYDNAPRYVTWYADVALEVAVDGALLPVFPMRSSGGQVFRGALPANLVGQVEYRVLAADEHGNQGASALQSYTAGGDAGASYGAGSPGGGAALAALTETHAGAPVYLRATAAPGAAVLLGVSLSKVEPPFAVPGLPGVVLNVGPLAFLASGTADGAGDLVHGGTLPAGTAGITLYAQAIALDAGALASSAGLALLVLP